MNWKPLNIIIVYLVFIVIRIAYADYRICVEDSSSDETVMWECLGSKLLLAIANYCWRLGKPSSNLACIEQNITRGLSTRLNWGLWWLRYTSIGIVIKQLVKRVCIWELSKNFSSIAFLRVKWSSHYIIILLIYLLIPVSYHF